MADDETVHRVYVTATVVYKLNVKAKDVDVAEQIAREIWSGDNGHTVEEWESWYGTNWSDVPELEFYAP